MMTLEQRINETNLSLLSLLRRLVLVFVLRGLVLFAALLPLSLLLFLALL